jgi:hypothetical protein
MGGRSSVIDFDDQHTDLNMRTCQEPINTAGVDRDGVAPSPPSRVAAEVPFRGHQSEPIARCKFAEAPEPSVLSAMLMFFPREVTHGPQKRTRLPSRVRGSCIVFRGSRRASAAATSSPAARPDADAEQAASAPLAAAPGYSDSAPCQSSHTAVRTMGRLLCGRPVGLYERSRLALGPRRDDHDRRRWRPVRLPLHAERRLDLVRLTLGPGPVSLRGMGSSDLAPGRVAWRLGGDPARFRPSGRSLPILSSLTASPGCRRRFLSARSPTCKRGFRG